MESVHGVDVSWLHQPNKEHHHRKSAPSTPGLPQDTRPPTSSHGGIPTTSPPGSNASQPQPTATPALPVPQQPAKALPAQTTSTSSTTPSKTQTRRPNILNRSGSDKQRRNSWISNISSKFSSSPQGQQQPAPSATPPQTSKTQINGTNAGASPVTARERTQGVSPPSTQNGEAQELQPYVPQKPRESTSSFFSSLTRRISSNNQTGGATDPNRERCLVPELDSTKLRRVAFSVDVEIAGGPRYKDEDDPSAKQKKTRDRKIKERAEGEALKHPEAVVESKERGDTIQVPVDDTAAEAQTDIGVAEKDAEGERIAHKKEKKRRSEEERKERKERRRKKAEENGTIPVEMASKDDDDEASDASSPPASGPITPKPQERPTTDPVRIYRRCCQLRESPILKRITEQLMSPTCTVPGDPGTVTCLNLTGSRLQLADVVTLGDWLAIVPVKRLLLEDADLTDEGIRVILAGLLAAKTPQPTKRRAKSDLSKPVEERSGIVEKIILKNNPKITRVGWKHIACFLYMCRSIKAIDVSMVHFPSTIPSTPYTGTAKSPETPSKTGQPVDAAEVLYKSLAGRRGGARLEELIMADCGLDAAQIRKIVDGVTVSGVARLGLASNQLDNEGFEYTLHYIRSGTCQIIDIGGNDLRGKLDRLAEALRHKSDCPVWGLSLAGCNLDTASLRALLPALVELRDFRFIDLSHNRELFGGQDCASHLLRKYLPKLKHLKRLHLVDVNMTCRQAIGIAEVLPEVPVLAHLNILENTPLSALVSSADENSQEEACALYAALMAAVKASKTIVCIDIDVPRADNSEVVKALAKQVVAYSLQNMELCAIPGADSATAVSTLTKPHGVSDPKEVSVPDVLLHLVGHVEGFHENHDLDGPAPEEDYIVGGTGVVKALQYCLGEKALEVRRGSFPVSGTTTPRDRVQEPDREDQRRGQAKEMSKNLLASARNIRARLQPALVKEAAAGDELAYRRLLLLDQTLQGMIQRFEDEYPETRLAPPSPKQTASLSSSLGTADSVSVSVPPDGLASSVGTLATEVSALSNDSDIDDETLHPPRMPSRHNSDVGIASRALALEEGRIHRLGQKVRRDVLNAPSSRPGSVSGPSGQEVHAQALEAIDPHLAELSDRLENLSGTELQGRLERDGWEGVLKSLGANYEELRQLQERDPVGWEQFKESQLKARANIGRGEEASAIE